MMPIPIAMLFSFSCTGRTGKAHLSFLPLRPRLTRLHTLKKEAKRWLKAVRANDEPARARLTRAYPQAPAEPGLRDIQHALALEHGLPGWTALKDTLADQELANRRHAERVVCFL